MKRLFVSVLIVASMLFPVYVGAQNRAQRDYDRQYRENQRQYDELQNQNMRNDLYRLEQQADQDRQEREIREGEENSRRFNEDWQRRNKW